MVTSPGFAPPDTPAGAARVLLRAARAASLGTIGVGGIPTVTLVTPATAPDLTVLLLLSSLSEHRRNLAEDARCGLMVTGVATSDNPQTAPRLSLSGRAYLVPEGEEADSRRRWLAAHPYAEGYAGFTDFALWRFVPERAHLIGGFAAAHRINLESLMPPSQVVARIAAAEAMLLAEFDRIAAVDSDGCDVIMGERSVRIAFDAPVGSLDALRLELQGVVRGL